MVLAIPKCKISDSFRETPVAPPFPRIAASNVNIEQSPVVVYSRDAPWNALGDVGETGVTVGGEVSLPVHGNYLLLDAKRRAREDLPDDNLVAAVFQLNAAETLDELRARVRSLLDRLRGEPRRAVFDWLRLVAPRMFTQADAAAAITALEREFTEVAKE